MGRSSVDVQAEEQVKGALAERDNGSASRFRPLNSTSRSRFTARQRYINSNEC